MLLAILRDYRAGDLSLKQVRTVLRRMEDFHVQFTAVTAQRTGGGTAFMYASSARQLFEASDKNAKQQILTDFADKLRDRVPSSEEFSAGFSEIWFTEQNTRARPVVRYLLRRLDTHFRDGAKPDYDTFTIEHLAPQNPAGKSAVSEVLVGSMGNLLFVSEEINLQLKNLAPVAKLQKLKDIGWPVDTHLLCAAEWTDKTIRERTDSLSSTFYDSILKV